MKLPLVSSSIIWGPVFSGPAVPTAVNALVSAQPGLWRDCEPYFWLLSAKLGSLSLLQFLCAS